VRSQRIVNRIKDFIRPDNAFMVCFISTPDEATLGTALGLDVLGAKTAPCFSCNGKRLFAKTGSGQTSGNLKTK